MSIAEYKTSLKNLIESTNDEKLLMQWKEQLEWDVKNDGEVELTDEEWQDVQEGLEDIKNGKTISFNEYLKKR